MKRIIVHLCKWVKKLFKMSYYEEGDLLRVTDLLEREVFPRHCLNIAFPAAVDNTVNTIYYALTFRDHTEFTIRIVFEDPRNYLARLELFGTTITNFDNLIAVSNHLHMYFDRNRIRLCDLFQEARAAKDLAR